MLHEPHARVLCLIRLCNLPTAVRRAILDEDNFKITKRLRENAVEAHREIRRNIVHWHNHRNFRSVCLSVCLSVKSCSIFILMSSITASNPPSQIEKANV